MALGLLGRKIQLNPELEKLRAKALQESSCQSNEWILHMIEKTSRLHAGFLFEDHKSLQKICLLICETQSKITDAGWKALGYHLGLSPSVLKVINHNNFNKEDPCYNILLAYVQYENATIGKVLEALHVIGRIDVLSQIRDSINNLADIILNTQFSSNSSNNSVEETSDYESLTASDGYETNRNLENSSSREELIRPKIIPPAPFIFQNIKATPEIICSQLTQTLSNGNSLNSYSSCEKDTCNDKNFNKVSCYENITRDFETKFVRETLQGSSCMRENNKPTTKQKYGLKILLTFAEDGEKYVDEICKIFRRKRENFDSIGVLVLSEHVERVNRDPQQFISGAFYQVDYVCPILTTGYYNLIFKKQKSTSYSNLHIDSVYVPYIYRLMNSYFVSNDCLNDKVRCIIPEIELSELSLTLMLKNPIFSAWVKLNEIEDLAVRLLKSATNRNFG